MHVTLVYIDSPTLSDDFNEFCREATAMGLQEVLAAERRGGDPEVPSLAEYGRSLLANGSGYLIRHPHDPPTGPAV